MYSQHVLERVEYTGVLVFGLVQLRGSPTDYRCNCRPSNVVGYLLSASSSVPDISRASSTRWGSHRPNGHSDWHASQGRESTYPTQYDMRAPARHDCVPTLHACTVPVPMRQCPQIVNWIIQAPSAVRAWLVLRLYYRSVSQSPTSIPFKPFVSCPDGTSSQSRAMRGRWPPPPLTAPSILL